VGRTDLELARAATLDPIARVAERLGLDEKDLELHGRYKAKIDLGVATRAAETPRGALVVVTAMTPTPAGEGKSTVAVGLADGLRRLGRRVVVALRQPSLGPCFGMKGGATGGGLAQVVPMEEINLHFTGDIHAVAAAHNLLSAMVDNHLAQDNALGLDPRRVSWKRVVDLNDRALRQIVIGLGGPAHGVPRESGFDIAVASEVMAILCLARDLHDLRARIARIVVGERADGTLVTAGDLKAAGALTVLLRDAIKPNLVQTIEGTPALIHGGPFGNIAHGCSSLTATRLGLGLADIVVTEAGFATDLGAEKFFDIKCRTGRLVPRAAVIVATVKALKHHGGVAKAALGREDVAAVRRGFENLQAHIDNVKQFGVTPVVALNHFTGDTDAEVAAALEICGSAGVMARHCRVWERGGEGGMELGEAVIEAVTASDPSKFRHLYPDDMPLAKKLETIATTIYGAAGLALAPAAAAKLARYESGGFGRLPVCVAKTQNSLSDDAKKIGRPRGFTVTIRDVRLNAGAGFIVAYAGDVLTMPGLPKNPAAEEIDIDASGQVVGLF
jgi:formate--tetrahydrofolate ligase